MDSQNLPEMAQPLQDDGPLKPRRPSRWPWLLALLLIVLGAIGLWRLFGPGQGVEVVFEGEPSQAKGAAQPAQPAAAGQPAPAIKAPPPSTQGPVVDVTPAPGDQTGAPQSAEQVERKQPYGLEKSVDAVVRSDESIKLGNQTVPVTELQRKLVVEGRGAMLETATDKKPQVTAWGVHAVRPGDSLWKIHYSLLREYLASRGVDLPANADQPRSSGQSSGVGKVLKFAEHMVGVYNLKTGHMSRDLDLLEPGEKVVVFNLSEIFDQLAQVDPRELNGVMYDGRVLLFPHKGTAPIPVKP